MRTSIVAILAAASLAAASPRKHEPLFENLVTFGDSYTDDGRLAYYAQHDGKAPPPGVYQNVSTVTASGGLAWGQYVERDLVPGISYIDYAVSGATCSNEIISRLLPSINRSFPSVLDDEIPSFEADIAGPHVLFPNRTAENTVYALWIGTNDLGEGAFLTDSQAPGTNLTSFVECTWEVLDRVYAAGGRRFVLFNQAPLQLAPMYAAQIAGGAGDNQYWPNKTQYNETEYQFKIMEYTTSVNAILAYGTPFHFWVKQRWPKASVTLFDVHQLLTDIYNQPTKYLDAPANATSSFQGCVSSNNCVDSDQPQSSFLWFDELHPSSKTDSIIAQHFVDAVAGTSVYGTTYKA